jgi:hypothetical protein
MSKMNPMNEAWALLKASPFYQGQQQGTSQEMAGGTLHPAFQQSPGRTVQAKGAEEFRQGGVGFGYKGNQSIVNKPRNFERQNVPSVTGERSFQSAQHMPGQKEADISRQPRQGFLQRRRDSKQQRLAQRAEETGEGKDYRAAYPTDASQGSVFDQR